MDGYIGTAQRDIHPKSGSRKGRKSGYQKNSDLKNDIKGIGLKRQETHIQNMF